MAVEFRGQGFNALAEGFGEFGELGVPVHEFEQLGGLQGGCGLAFFIRTGDRLAMGGVRFRIRFITIRLAGLREQDERRGVGGLQTEGEIEKDERVDIETDGARGVQNDPGGDDDGLGDEESRRAEKAGERLCLQREPVVSENGGEMQIGPVEAEVISGGRFFRRNFRSVNPV